ncbi:YccF domain-containing protein [Bacteroides caecigallinarum]|uniref:YccF domain-containing protein n=1 Tax=Bacteroides caecigallinarum TaxID=1411144 RepID=UPI00195AB52D|nr:YccF domain-containing protein [Bacteroides caecigallinarum]MBM6882721.1 YccF domain-containing protein [Bacteroides caecigallinarum]
MNILMNILWIILGGLLVCLEYIVASLLLMITIIGIPFGLQTIKLAMLALLPFGAKVQSTPSDGGCLNVLMNLLWILLGGVWIALTHLLFGALLCITVIGIPFGMQHFKLAGLALTPFGKTIV